MRTLMMALAAAVLLLSGCASSPERTTHARPDLAGGWTFQVQTGQNVTHGALTLVAEGPQYRGTLTTDQGNNVLKVRSLTLEGPEMLMVVESPNGLVTFKGILNPGARSFQGTVTYFNGQNFPMSGKKS